MREPASRYYSYYLQILLLLWYYCPSDACMTYEALLFLGLVRTDIFREVAASWYLTFQSIWFIWFGKSAK